MQLKLRSLYAVIIVVLLLSFIVGGWAWSRFLVSQSSNNSLSTLIKHTPVPTATVAALDIRSGGYLQIPSIGVNAPVETIGVDPDGKLSVPTRKPWDGVGWYQGGPQPGEMGSAVIDGHLDRPGGAPAIFWNLNKLHVGDAVMVKNATGLSLHFRVTKLQYYAPQDAPTAQIFGNKSGVFLNLITCAGAWIAAQHQTTQRLVVYTTLL